MTTTQARSRLVKAGLYDQARITIIRGVEIEIMPKNADDHRNSLGLKISKLLCLGGYRTGYGSWVLREGYKTDGKGWSDRTSQMHY